MADTTSSLFFVCSNASFASYPSFVYRHLRAAGWNIIEIPYWEWEQRRDLYARKRYLGRKLEPISDRLWGEHTVNN